MVKEGAPVVGLNMLVPVVYACYWPNLGTTDVEDVFVGRNTLLVEAL